MITFLELNEALADEQNTRTEREKEILQKLDDEKYKLTEQLDKESTDRRLTLKELRDDTQNELKQIESYA